MGNNHTSVLVVEDESITGMYLELVLKRKGYTVYEIATSGEDAINFANKDKPKIILMDIRLEGEIDGITAAQRIRSFCNSPIIFMTGYSDPKIKERASKIPNTRYLEKPVSNSDLFTTIQSFTSGSE
jgi:CheY-like chemotaxis protein